MSEQMKKVIQNVQYKMTIEQTLTLYWKYIKLGIH